MDKYITIYNSFSPPLKRLWLSFEIEAAWSPFQTFGWLSHWYETVGEPLHSIIPQIAVIKRNKKVIAILPFGIRDWMGIRVLEWLGGIHTDYMGPLISAKSIPYLDDFNILWENILDKIDQIDVIHLKRQPEDIGSVRNPFTTSLQVDHTESAFRARNKGTWESYYNFKIKKKQRADSVRQHRRLKEKGQVDYIEADTEQKADTIVSKMIELKRKRYLDTGLTDMLAIKEHRELYHGVVGLPMGQYHLTCSALTVNNITISTHVGIIGKSCFYYLMPANDNDAWKRYSSGRLLLEFLMERSFKSGIEVFDFTVGAEQYKKQWCNEELKLFEYSYPINIMGKIYAFAMTLVKVIKGYPLLWRFFRKLKQFS